MRHADDSSFWQRVQTALEACFLALDRGETPSVAAVCGDDAELAEHVSKLLASTVGTFLVPPSDAAPAGPRTFGDFELVRPLGRGGMGRVFLANQTSLSRQVALKLLDQGALHLPGSRVRFRREAELTALLEHPNIVPIYAVGEHEGVPFLAMKYLTGPSLADVSRPLSPQQVAQIG